jgi:hypothetical protein
MATASYPEVRSDHQHANSFRTAPSLCADMIFGKDKGSLLYAKSCHCEIEMRPQGAVTEVVRAAAYG